MTFSPFAAAFASMTNQPIRDSETMLNAAPSSMATSFAAASAKESAKVVPYSNHYYGLCAVVSFGRVSGRNRTVTVASLRQDTLTFVFVYN